MWHDARLLNATATGIFAVTLLACAGSVLSWLLHMPAFTLRAIRVEGMEKELRNVNYLTVREGTAGRLQGNFFSADLEKVRLSFEQVPWVRRASVRRVWPDRLVVTIEEHEALGTWGEDGRLLSRKGDVFTANLAEADEDHALPAFSGPAGSEKEVAARYVDLASWFAPLGFVPTSLRLSERYAWTVTLDNGMSVALGREVDSDTLRTRVARLVQVWPRLARGMPRIARIDLRYPSGMALSAKEFKLVTSEAGSGDKASPHKMVTAAQAGSEAGQAAAAPAWRSALATMTTTHTKHTTTKATAT